MWDSLASGPVPLILAASGVAVAWTLRKIKQFPNWLIGPVVTLFVATLFVSTTMRVPVEKRPAIEVMIALGILLGSSACAAEAKVVGYVFRKLDKIFPQEDSNKGKDND